MRIGSTLPPSVPAPQDSGPQKTAAVGYLILSRTAQIAGSLAAAPGPAPTATQDADLDAWADLAEIHDLLTETPSTDQAAQIANQLLTLFKSCDTTVQNAITAAEAGFITNAGIVTGFSQDASGNYTFVNWWSQPGPGNPPSPSGIQQAFNWISSLSQQQNPLQPSVNPAAYTPDAFVNLGMIYIDAMTIPNAVTGGTNFDNTFWGNQAGTSLNFSQIFPYALVLYQYQMEFNDPSGGKSWQDLNTKIQALFDMMPTPGTLTPSNPPHYMMMYNTLQNLIPLSPNNTFANWPANITLYFTPPGSNQPDPSDLSSFYGVLLGSWWNNYLIGGGNLPPPPHQN